jgi:predicted DNA binding protein
MQLVDSTIQVQHPCPFCDISVAFPDVTMAQWCNGRREILEIASPNPDQMPEILSMARKTIAGLEEVVRCGNSVLTIRGCTCYKYRSVCALCDDSECWVIPPIQYYGGYEVYRILSPGKAPLRRLVKQLKEIGTVRILSTRPAANLNALLSIGTIPVHFFEGLTDRQLHSLVSAFEKGLLEIPQKNRLDKVAKEEGFSRSTYGEHLRKAIHRIVQNSYPIMKLYDSGIEKPKNPSNRKVSDFSK